MDISDNQRGAKLLRILAASILLLWLVSLCLACLDHGILVPFSWPEMGGVVQIASSLPLAWLVWHVIGSKIAGEAHSMGMALVLSAAFLGAFRLLFWNLVDIDAPLDLLANAGILLRTTGGIMAAMGIVGIVNVCYPPRFIPDHTPMPKAIHRSWVLAILVLALVPITFQFARCKADAATAHEFLSQSRLVEGDELLRHCLVLDADTMYQGKPLRETLEPLAVEIVRLRRHVQQPLAENASERQRIERGTVLAILGQNEEALLTLLPAANMPLFGELGGHQLLGTLYQDRHDWNESLFHFQRAYQAVADEKKQDQAQSLTSQSLQGQAFALRKLGHIDQAEAAYLQLLSLAPSADNHFLLAQFYNDIQDTSRATYHAEEAQRLDPARFEASGEALVTQAKANHFGCFQLLGN